VSCCSSLGLPGRHLPGIDSVNMGRGVESHSRHIRIPPEKSLSVSRPAANTITEDDHDPPHPFMVVRGHGFLFDLLRISGELWDQNNVASCP
jgi:hypothetical protein